MDMVILVDNNWQLQYLVIVQVFALLVSYNQSTLIINPTLKTHPPIPIHITPPNQPPTSTLYLATTPNTATIITTYYHTKMGNNFHQLQQKVQRDKRSRVNAMFADQFVEESSSSSSRHQRHQSERKDNHREIWEKSFEREDERYFDKGRGNVGRRGDKEEEEVYSFRGDNRWGDGRGERERHRVVLVEGDSSNRGEGDIVHNCYGYREVHNGLVSTLQLDANRVSSYPHPSHYPTKPTPLYQPYQSPYHSYQPLNQSYHPYYPSHYHHPSRLSQSLPIPPSQLVTLLTSLIHQQSHQSSPQSPLSLPTSINPTWKPLSQPSLSPINQSNLSTKRLLLNQFLTNHPTLYKDKELFIWQLERKMTIHPEWEFLVAERVEVDGKEVEELLVRGEGCQYQYLGGGGELLLRGYQYQGERGRYGQYQLSQSQLQSSLQQDHNPQNHLHSQSLNNPNNNHHLHTLYNILTTFHTLLTPLSLPHHPNSLPIAQLYSITPSRLPFSHKLTIHHQFLPIRLPMIRHLTHLQGIYVLQQALLGFMMLYEVFGGFMVREEMVGVSVDGFVKVWVGEEVWGCWVNRGGGGSGGLGRGWGSRRGEMGGRQQGGIGRQQGRMIRQERIRRQEGTMRKVEEIQSQQPHPIHHHHHPFNPPPYNTSSSQYQQQQMVAQTFLIIQKYSLFHQSLLSQTNAFRTCNFEKALGLITRHKANIVERRDIRREGMVRFVDRLGFEGEQGVERRGGVVGDNGVKKGGEVEGKKEGGGGNIGERLGEWIGGLFGRGDNNKQENRQVNNKPVTQSITNPITNNHQSLTPITPPPSQSTPHHPMPTTTNLPPSLPPQYLHYSQQQTQQHQSSPYSSHIIVGNNHQGDSWGDGRGGRKRAQIFWEDRKRDCYKGKKDGNITVGDSNRWRGGFGKDWTYSSNNNEFGVGFVNNTNTTNGNTNNTTINQTTTSPTYNPIHNPFPPFPHPPITHPTYPPLIHHPTSHHSRPNPNHPNLNNNHSLSRLDHLPHNDDVSCSQSQRSSQHVRFISIKSIK